MLRLLAHDGLPPAPHDVWEAWNLDPFVVVPLAVVLVVHRCGRRRPGTPTARRRSRAFDAAWWALVVALVSPVDALSSALASAHMLQHVLLVLVAAPLLAVAAPLPTLLRGLPPVVARALVPARHGPLGTVARGLAHPAIAWIVHVATLWGWHASAAYDAALAVPAVHAAEQVSFVLTGVLLWRSLVGPHRVRTSDGVGVLAVFGLALQSVLLAALLTFAEGAWYDGYTTTTAAWGLTPLGDQQLAGAIMWIPAGALHVGVGLALFVTWLHSGDASTSVRRPPWSPPGMRRAPSRRGGQRP